MFTCIIYVDRGTPTLMIYVLELNILFSVNDGVIEGATPNTYKVHW